MRTSICFKRCWINDKPLVGLGSTAIEDLCCVRKPLVGGKGNQKNGSQDGVCLYGGPRLQG